jgi:hypothetical protein
LLAPAITPDLLELLAEIHLSTDHRDLLLIWILIGGRWRLIVFPSRSSRYPCCSIAAYPSALPCGPVCAPSTPICC